MPKPIILSSNKHNSNKLISFLSICWGRFFDKGQDCKISPHLSLGSLEVLICRESCPKFQYLVNKG